MLIAPGGCSRGEVEEQKRGGEEKEKEEDRDG